MAKSDLRTSPVQGTPNKWRVLAGLNLWPLKANTRKETGATVSYQSKPMFEPLESRQLMSAGASLNAGVLRIEGTDSADKVIIQDFDRTVRIGKNSVVLHRVQVTVTDPSGTVRADSAGNPVQRS